MRLGEEDDRSCDLALVRREEGAQRERRRDEVVRAKKEMEKVSFMFAFSFVFYNNNNNNSTKPQFFSTTKLNQ